MSDAKESGSHGASKRGADADPNGSAGAEAPKRNGLAPRGKAIDPAVIEHVRRQVEEAVAPFRHLRLERVRQFVSEIMGRPRLRPAVEVTLSGYSPSLHAATTSFRLGMGAIDADGVAETVDEEMQKQIAMHEGRRRLSLATFGREVAPLPRDQVGHLTTGSLDIDVLVEIEGGPQGALRRIIRGVDTVISRREAGDHRATPRSVSRR